MKLQCIVVDLQLSRGQRRLIAALAGLSLFGAAAVAYAVPKHTWQSGDALTASDLNMTIGDLDSRLSTLESGDSPAGAVTSFAGTGTPPLGWLACDGSEVGRAAFPKLFATIGTAWGKGDGSTTFTLPDLRGRFLRGMDGGAGHDPDAVARLASGPGGAVGDTVGTLESDLFASHDHGGKTGGTTTPPMWTNAARDYSGGGGPTCRGFSYSQETGCGNYFDEHIHTIVTQGGAETRPANVTVKYLIKY